MRLKEYFEERKGIGVLATADADGKANVAIYARPHFLGDNDQEVSFIMNDRLSHDNVNSNPRVAYLFVEQTDGYVGKRLFLTKIGEDTDQERIRSMRRRTLPAECDEEKSKKRFLVHFRVDGIRPLIGTEE
jgi:hypothetical protein